MTQVIHSDLLTYLTPLTYCQYQLCVDSLVGKTGCCDLGWVYFVVNIVSAGRNMYWTDAQRGIIESSALDGSGRVVLIDERSAALTSNKSSVVRPHYYGIALDQNYIYYTDWARGSVHPPSYSLEQTSPNILR